MSCHKRPTTVTGRMAGKNNEVRKNVFSPGRNMPADNIAAIASAKNTCTMTEMTA